jgi:ornithine cyclodeaminase
MELRFYSAEDVNRALPMTEAIEAMKAGFAQLSAGHAIIPLRTAIPVSERDATLVMSYFAPDDGGSLGLKLVSVFNSNVPRGIPLINSVVLALDPQTGAPQALIEGSSLTAIRTGAASGAATDILARRNSTTLAVVGTGTQARRQLEAVCAVRPIEQVRVFSRNSAEAFAAEMAGVGRIPDRIEVASSHKAAIAGADIICAATTSRTPVFDGRDLSPGTHINGVGSFTPDMQEIDEFTVRQARVVVDSLEAALAEAGDLIVPLNAGRIDIEHISTELGEILNGHKPGRTRDDQITFFKSVGVSIQDAMAARIILRNGPAMGMGIVVEL